MVQDGNRQEGQKKRSRPEEGTAKAVEGRPIPRSLPHEDSTVKASELDSRPIEVRRIIFSEIDPVPEESGDFTGNMRMLLDIPLDVRVELGRTRRLLREVLTIGPGSVIELDKLAGEPVDVLVNGKAVAKGEVVVVDENFGVKISEIANPALVCQ
jgi:flagellar motor switch protein FliN/FliY